MLVAFLVISWIVTMGCSIWMLVIIFKRSVVGGLLSALFGFPVFYFLFTGWGKEGEDIRKPFFIGLAPFAIGIVVAFMYFNSMVEEAKRGRESPSETVLRQATPVDRKTRTSPTVAKEPMVEAPAAHQPVAVPEPAAKPRPVAQRSEPVRTPVTEVPQRRKAASDCVFKPVMTDEDMAKCR
jgi:hypothetical protein